MKNSIIVELRRIRDKHACGHNYDLEAMACDWMTVEPWMKCKLVTFQKGRMASAFPRRKAEKSRSMQPK